MQAWIPYLVFLLPGIQEGLAQTSEDQAVTDASAVVAFVNVAVISMQDEAVLRAQTVVIEGDRIALIGPVDSTMVPPKALVIRR